MFLNLANVLQDLGSRDPTFFSMYGMKASHAVEIDIIRTKNRVYFQIRKLPSGSNYINKLDFKPRVQTVLDI